MTRADGGAEQAAEILALAALGFLAADEDRLMRFLALTGLGLDQLRDRASDPAFLAGIFDYLLGDEPLLLAFAAEQNLPPEKLARMRRHLPGMWEA